MRTLARLAAPLNKKLLQDLPSTSQTLNEEELQSKTCKMRRSYLSLSLNSPTHLVISRLMQIPATYKLAACFYKNNVLRRLSRLDIDHGRLMDAKRLHATTQRKYLAILWAALLMRQHFKNSIFPRRTDHNCLNWTLNLTKSTERLPRWRRNLSKDR